MIDVAVLGQDPLFGGGSRAQITAFVEAARSLGRDPHLLYEPHPGLRGPRLTWRRIDALRQLAAARRRLPAARSTWVVTTHATNGGAAMRSRRPYDAWVGTTLEAEWRGRAPGLPRARRAAAAVSIHSMRRLERDVLRNARRLYATSEASRRDLRAASGRDDLNILPIPVDLAQLRPEPDEAWRATLDRPTLVFVGRADDPRKNLSLLLAAVARLPSVRLRLVGVPPRRPLPDRVEAAGVVPDLGAAFHGATLFVLPSRQEGFGIVVAEALAAGVPVVTTPCGGPEELVRASGGGRVLRGFDAEELAATVGELLARPAELAAMRRAGRAYVEREHSPARLRDLLSEPLA